MAISRKKAVLFSVIPSALLLLLLALAEAALRLFVPGLSSPLLVSTQDGMVMVNRGYLEKFFPASSALIPELKPTMIRSAKPPGLFRVLCLGESSMLGTPYEMSGTIPGIFRKQLRHAAPDREIEVINLAAAAINTNVIKELAEKSLEIQPDLVLVYTGHNEFYGPDGVGASFLERHLPFLTGWKYALRDLRLVRLIQNALHSIAARNAGEQNLMKQVSENAWVDLNSVDAERVFGMFNRNLRTILATFQDKKIPVIVSDVTSNLLFSPFAYPTIASLDHLPGLVNSGRWQEAESLLQRATTSDSNNAYVWYWRGMLDRAKGRYGDARAELSRARDLDMLKFRAPERTNQITRQVCNEMGIPCVSADSLFASLSPGGIPGNDLFWEHLHPKLRGYYEIAGMLFRDAARHQLVPVAEGTPHPVLPFNTDTLAICWLDQAFGDLSIHALTSRWPFQNLEVEPAVFPSSPEKAKEIALRVYGRKMGWSEGLVESAAEFHRLGMFRTSATTYQAMLDEYQEGYYTRYLLGTVLKDSGDVAGATTQYAAAIRLNPQYPYPRVDLGLIEINRGNLDSAHQQLRTALDLCRQQEYPATLRASIFYGLAAIAANRGDYSAALANLDESLKLFPSYVPAQTLQRALKGRK